MYQNKLTVKKWRYILKDKFLFSNGFSGVGAIRLTDVHKTYITPAGRFDALKGITLQINRGELVMVVGKSGSGKSTLLNMLTGIDRPTTGDICIGTSELHRMSEGQMSHWRGMNVGIVFQFFQLLPTLTTVENVMLAMDFSRTLPVDQRRKRAMDLLDRVGIAPQADKLPAFLSGGEQQRTALARALANDPPILVADEPTGNLDSETAGVIFDLLESQVSAGKTVIIVTHDRELSTRAPRVIRLADGKISEDN
jgi:putative ABC transport system ATP-binding protein